MLPKTYKVVITYDKYKSSKKIKIKHVIRAKKYTYVSKNGTSAKLTILLKSSKVLKNKKISVKFLTKTYTLKTNKKGYAFLKINQKTISGLRYSSTHLVTIKYDKDVLKRYVKVRSKSASNFNVYFIL